MRRKGREKESGKRVGGIEVNRITLRRETYIGIGRE